MKKVANSFNEKIEKDPIQLVQHKLHQNYYNNKGREKFLFIFRTQFSQTRYTRNNPL